ncbi:MAG: hypothetical protein PVI91_06305 [Gammaproteobacteria bacterium]
MNRKHASSIASFSDTASPPPAVPLFARLLAQQNHYRGTGRTGAGNGDQGSRPACLDQTTGTAWLSRFADGHVASVHVLDGSGMNARQRSRLINLNRVLIFALTFGGLLMDGLQLADLFCTLALFVWLWLPLCTRLEAHLLQRIDGKHGSAGSARTSPSM